MSTILGGRWAGSGRVWCVAAVWLATAACTSGPGALAEEDVLPIATDAGLEGAGGAMQPGGGTGGSLGTGGGAGGTFGGGDAGMIDAGPELEPPPCLKSGSQVVLLGDSYINWVSHTFPADLNNVSGETFRMYAVGGYSMGSGGIGFIPPELDQAVAADPDITTIVMTGGGNDILVADTAQFPRGGDCKMVQDPETIPDCVSIVDTALDAANTMMDEGVSKLDYDGVIHVVYFFYPNVPDGTLIGGTYPNAMLEYALPRVKDFCDSTFERSGERVMCHFVDMRPVFEGHPEYFVLTDIHPNAAGSAAMADAVWETMVDNCIAQPESTGCCTP